MDAKDDAAAMKIAFFGSSLVSAYWNGAATYYRGIIKALHALGHDITFYEPDAYERQQHRDMEDPPWATVRVYSAQGHDGLYQAIEEAEQADVIVKASGVGVFDEFLDKAVVEVKRPQSLAIYWDVDAPATLDRMRGDIDDRLRELVPSYDLVLTYGGGDPVVNAYAEFGAKRCVPIYNALDRSTHFPAPPDDRFAGDIGFLGNRLPDREARVEEFFLKPAAQMPEQTYVLGGNGWGDKARTANVRYVGHVYTVDHNAFNSSTRAVLNISRESMARYGYSPATRVFEAAGAAACLITDEWQGIDLFLDPSSEVLVARNGEEVAELVRELTPQRARQIGWKAQARVIAEHTYAHRAQQVHELIGAAVQPAGGGRGRKPGRSTVEASY